jgi:MFS transporter, DHA3 family, macrolide efflux protein
MLRKRPLRLIFTANAISMIGSGMNSAAVVWYILQATHTEVALGTLIVLQTIPSMLLMPFGGVVIDREDRRRLIMTLDVMRALLILAVAVLVFRHEVKLWHLYMMSVLVSAGFWMFWPSITALLQELTPGDEYVYANTFIMAGVQVGWVVAGGIVGFVYNHIGLGGILLIDVCTYVISVACYAAVRKGRHVVSRPDHLEAELAAISHPVTRFQREILQAFEYLKANRYVILLGLSWSFFVGGMLTSGVVTAPLSDRVLRAGAVGYGWLNMGWATGATVASIATPLLIRKISAGRSISICMFLLSACVYFAPYTHWLALAVATYALMGSARGLGGTALTTGMMEAIPKHFMGRVQNTFSMLAIVLQLSLGLVVGALAHRYSLASAFCVIGSLYLLAFVTATWAERTSRQFVSAAATARE